MWDPPRWSPFPVCISGPRSCRSGRDLTTRPHRRTPEPRGTRTPRNGSPEREPGDPGTVRWGTREPDTPELHTAETIGSGIRTWWVGAWPPGSQGCAGAAAVQGQRESRVDPFWGSPVDSKRGQASGWQDRGDNQTPCVRVLPDRSAGLSSLLSILIYERHHSGQ